MSIIVELHTTRKSKDNNSLSLEEIIAGYILPVKRIRSCNLGISNTSLEDYIGDNITYLGRLFKYKFLDDDNICIIS